MSDKVVLVYLTISSGGSRGGGGADLHVARVPLILGKKKKPQKKEKLVG